MKITKRQLRRIIKEALQGETWSTVISMSPNGDSVLVKGREVDPRSIAYELEAASGQSIPPDEAKDLAKLGEKITQAANEQLNFYHPTYSDWDHFSFCHFCGPLLQGKKGKNFKSAVAIKPGKIDRSPTGTALSAKMAILHKRGKIKIGEQLTASSIIDSEFTGQILGLTKVGNVEAILPEISGRAWITGTHQHMLDPADHGQVVIVFQIPGVFKLFRNISNSWHLCVFLSMR